MDTLDNVTEEEVTVELLKGMVRAGLRIGYASLIQAKGEEAAEKGYSGKGAAIKKQILDDPALIMMFSSAGLTEAEAGDLIDEVIAEFEQKDLAEL